MSKADYVRSQGQTRSHHCHWPGCDKQVPPAMWGCRTHWFKLPMYLRNKVWAAYRPGQEVNMTPSDEYLDVAREVQAWIVERTLPDRKGDKIPEPVYVHRLVRWVKAGQTVAVRLLESSEIMPGLVYVEEVKGHKVKLVADLGTEIIVKDVAK